MTRAARLVATCFGVGYLPVAPGTWASLAALPLAYPLALLGGSWALLAGAVLVFGLGLWAAGAILAPGLKDPADIVIDEVAGQFLALVPVAQDPLWWPAAFVLFRIADIGKPWPISAAERLPGSFGVMADDMVAGACAAAVLAAVVWAVGMAG